MARSTLKRRQHFKKWIVAACNVIFFGASVGAVYVWFSWMTYPRSRDSALGIACWLLLTYLAVAIRRRRGYAMRAFVLTSVTVLLLYAFRWVRKDETVAALYLGLPPLAALVVKIVQGWVNQARGKDDDSIECENCGYNLTGNVSGVCPECGTKISSWL